MAEIDSYVKLMLHMNSDFTDSSDSGHTPTVNGATIDTGIKKFGAGSGKFVSASSQYVTYPDHADWNPSDLTIDLRVRWNGSVSSSAFFSQYNSDANKRTFQFESNLLSFVDTQSGTDHTYISGSWTPSADTWYHVAVVRNGNNWYLFVDGSIIATAVDSNSLPDIGSLLYIGRRGDPSRQHNGWIDEYRFSNTARWTSDFTPATQEYSAFDLNTSSLNMKWGLTAPTGPVLLSLNQLYTLDAPALYKETLNQRYNLDAPTLYKETLNQRYGLDVYILSRIVLNQRYRLDIYTTQTASLNQLYSLSGVVLNNTSLNQRYALDAPTLNKETLNQLWALVVPTGPHLLSLNQRYVFNGYHIPATIYHAVTYTLTLTGAPDGLSDIVLPMSSFQSRLKAGDPSWMSVIVPNGRQYADSVNARPNGEIVVVRNGIKADGTPESIEIARVELERIRTDEGGKKSSITLSGHKTTAAGTPKGVALELINLKSVYQGKIHVESKMDSNVRPGDEVEVDSGVFTVGEILFTINPRVTKMRITEA